MTSIFLRGFAGRSTERRRMNPKMSQKDLSVEAVKELIIYVIEPVGSTHEPTSALRSLFRSAGEKIRTSFATHGWNEATDLRVLVETEISVSNAGLATFVAAQRMATFFHHQLIKLPPNASGGLKMNGPNIGYVSPRFGDYALSMIDQGTKAAVLVALPGSMERITRRKSEKMPPEFVQRILVQGKIFGDEYWYRLASVIE